MISRNLSASRRLARMLRGHADVGGASMASRPRLPDKAPGSIVEKIPDRILIDFGDPSNQRIPEIGLKRR